MFGKKLRCKVCNQYVPDRCACLLMQDENSGRDGRRYNEWFASKPDARLRAREAAEAIDKAKDPLASRDQQKENE